MDREFIQNRIAQLEQGIRNARAQLGEAEAHAEALREAIDLNRGAILAYQQMLEKTAEDEKAEA